MNQIIETAICVLEKERDAIDNIIKNFDSERYIKVINMILNTKGKVVVMGMGKAGHIGNKFFATLASTGTPAFALNPGESNHGDIGAVDGNDLIIAVSNSGESNELFKPIKIGKARGCKIITLTNNDNSTVAKMGEVNLKNFVQAEACPYNLAPTSSTTATLALMDAIAISTMVERGFTPEDFGASHPNGSLGRGLLAANDEEILKPLPAVKQGISLAEANKAIGKYQLGCLVVVDEFDNLAGFMALGEVQKAIDYAFDNNQNPKTAIIDNHMITMPISIPSTETAKHGYNTMKERDISSIIVMDDKTDKPVGVLTLKDCYEFFG